MEHHIVGRYRGFVIEAHIEPREARLCGGIALTYRVTWSLRRMTRKPQLKLDGIATDWAPLRTMRSAAPPGRSTPPFSERRLTRHVQMLRFPKSISHSRKV
ncbi:hypothetical protein E2553_39485 [Paraburkholderia dipogonis]|uniref:Uncharacterized protein n=1 Tax=Paraburkholderia dipogonis TaxID=1211383 RepID=A0A4Y8MJA8_9BURK|nr:hypothetical protein E2553_39485 [Paraburkholderia dipogonis]